MMAILPGQMTPDPSKRYKPTANVPPGQLPGAQGVKNILLVDDDVNSPLLVSIALKQLHPCPVLRYVPNALEATEYLLCRGAFADRIANPFPHLVILDLRMPMMDGFDFLIWARSLPELKALPIVVLTDSMNPQDFSRAYQLGATSILVKPSDMADLADPIKVMLALHC
jgi:CheY-like chemotaxis protein